MPQPHERVFYEVLWRAHARSLPYFFPWWTSQYFHRWTDGYDPALFESKEAAFASNAFYRYWNLVGVKDATQETLVGQAGEVEPVYDKYALSFLLFDPATRAIHSPQSPDPAAGAAVRQELEAGYLPVVSTRFECPALHLEVEEKVLSTVVGTDRKALTLVRFRVRAVAGQPAPPAAWLCLAVSPAGPSGFQRHDKAGRYLEDGRIGYLRYLAQERRLEVTTSAGPVFDTAPVRFGLYGGDGTGDAEHYLRSSPFADLAATGALNGASVARDRVAGMCSAVFAWDVNVAPAGPSFDLDVRLPVDDFRGAADFQELSGTPCAALEQANRTFWTGKLDGSGTRIALPAGLRWLSDLFRVCRSHLLILADGGQIHPGPTIYDSFWVRDSSVEGIAAALAGDRNLAERQFGWHYPGVFNVGSGWIGPARQHGFFGGEHEKNDREWDANGQALWALARLDRVLGRASGFGEKMYAPYVMEGARWIRDNRDQFGLLHSGWSAEHLGDKDKPHYWDDFWALAGQYEAARLAERISEPGAQEIWAAYDDLRRATVASIRYVLGEQRRQGHWETFIPTGPADIGRRDSTMVGTLAYFHPCRLYMGAKLGVDVDYAARRTLDTLLTMVTGGLRHVSWNAYGPYLTLQLAHACLFVGDLARMRSLLEWSAKDAAYARIGGAGGTPWQVVSGAWNEQHCYPIASDFGETPTGPWYMGDIPHGWAAAELILLARDMLFFEADEDGAPHVYIAAGIPPEWVLDGEAVEIRGAPTVFGSTFGYRLTHDATARTVTLEILEQLPSNVALVFPFRFGHASSLTIDGVVAPLSGADIRIPGGAARAVVRYD